MKTIARSLLFVPATSDRKIDKAFASAAHGVIVDLEDAVAVSEKPAARHAVGEIVAAPRPLPCWVRINAMSTEFCHQDVIAATIPGVAGIVLPKVESAEDVRTIDWLMSQIERLSGMPVGSVGLIGIVETARGLVAVDAIAGSCKRLSRLIFGAVDLAADMAVEIADDAGASAQARFAVTRASVAARLDPPLDTAFTDIVNLDALRATSTRARALGYGGKCCIHPAQVAVVNEVFAPTERELAWARSVVDAFAEAERQGVAAVRLDGQMIDYPVAERARRLLGAASA